MKKIYLILHITIFTLSYITARDHAYSLDSEKRQMSFFQPNIFTFDNKYELSIHPLLFFVLPNAKIKKFHNDYNGLGIATRYGFYYPTPILKILQKKGKFGFISKDPEIRDIPQLWILQSEVLATKIFSNYHITSKFGLSLCIDCDLDPRHIIDYDLIYHRMAIYKHGYSTNTGIDFDLFYFKNLSFKADLDLFILPKEKPFLEHKLLLNYHFLKKMTLTAGYKFCYGNLPFNRNNEFRWNLFPIIDLSWSWTK